MTAFLTLSQLSLAASGVASGGTEGWSAIIAKTMSGSEDERRQADEEIEKIAHTPGHPHYWKALTSYGSAVHGKPEQTAYLEAQIARIAHDPTDVNYWNALISYGSTVHGRPEQTAYVRGKMQGIAADASNPHSAKAAEWLRMN